MTLPLQTLQQSLTDAINALNKFNDNLAELLTPAAKLISESLINNGKCLIAASETSHYLADLFAHYLLQPVTLARPSLPAVRLPIANHTNEKNHPDSLAQQCQALGQENDTVFILTQDNNNPQIASLLNTAKQLQLTTLVMTSEKHNIRADCVIHLPAKQPEHVLHLQFVSTYCLCHLIEHHLFSI